MLLALLLALPAASPRAAVAAAHPLAAEAGASMLRGGGNAIDAAVAAAFALGVVEPMSSGLGGGGFALVYTADDREVHAIDFRETAPGRAAPDMFVKDGQPRQDLSEAGPLSVAVPGAVKGYVELLKRFGKKPLQQILSPAIALASRGFPVGMRYALIAGEQKECLAADPEAARLFLRNGKALAPGDRLAQPDLARTLQAIAQHGADAFYKGRIARALVDSLHAKGGILELSDLAAVNVRERKPVESTYRGRRIVTMPLPSSGGFFLLALLNVLEHEEPRAGGYRPERFLHVMVETEKRLFALRQNMGDPAFNIGLEDRVRGMITREFAADLWKQIGEKATPAAQLVPPREHGTSSISAVDEAGNAIVITTTVNGAFGSCVVAKGTGVLLNDEMDDFAVAPGVANIFGLTAGPSNAPAPGKIPLSSMAPTLMFSPGGSVELAIGAAGGSTIPTTIAQAIIHLVDDGMPIDRAIAAPRLHQNLIPDAIAVEPSGLEAATAHALEARGHTLRYAEEALHSQKHGNLDTPWGKACAVQVDAVSGWRLASCDPRAEGGGAAP